MEGPLTNGEPTQAQIDADATGWRVIRYGVSRLDWIIVGGESGPGARPMHPQWARDIRDQCERAGVAFFYKQWGEWGDRVDAIHVSRQSAIWRDGVATLTHNTAKALDAMRAGACVVQRVGKARAGRMLDGDTHDDMPRSKP